jgi:quinol monooxygenase YgiN
MGIVAICTYRPKPGRERDFLALLKTHLPTLRAEGLITAQPPLTARAADGTVVEVFEWASAAARRQAHENPAVQACWGKFDALADFVTLGSLAEAQRPFADFETIAL